MAKGDNVVVNCPHCGRPSSYRLKSENTGETNNCRNRGKFFTIDFQNGQIRDVRK
jgi:transcription elongation factor Elf1